MHNKLHLSVTLSSTEDLQRMLLGRAEAMQEPRVGFLPH